MAKKKQPIYDPIEAIQNDTFDFNRPVQEVNADIVSVLKILLDNDYQMRSDIDSIKYDLTGKADKQYRSEY